jgi:hypothetical protein
MFIRVLILIGSRRKAVRLFTHFYPPGLDMPLVNLAQSMRSCSCPCSWRNSVLSYPQPFSTRSRAPGRGSLCFPLTAQPQKKPLWAAVAACGVLSGRLARLSALSAGRRDTSKPENGRYSTFTEYILEGEARERGRVRVVQRCHVWCKNNENLQGRAGRLQAPPKPSRRAEKSPRDWQPHTHNALSH